MQHSQSSFSDWSKIQKSLKQEYRNKGGVLMRLERVMGLLPQVIAHCGPSTAHRRMILKVAHALLKDSPLIYAPCCPDYTHQNGLYTFRGLGSGVSLLAEQQIAFLRPITELFPEARVTFLLADQEAYDPALSAAMRISQQEFAERIRGSLILTNQKILSYGWQTCFMTDVIKDLRVRAFEVANRIRTDSSLHARLMCETFSRTPMYEQINKWMKHPEMLERTIKTASEYVVVGTFVAEMGGLMSNHTTTNLAWYGETGVAVLHNPISLY